MHRLKRVMNSLEHDELLKLKKEIDRGNLDLNKEVLEKVKESEKKHAKYCTTCSSDLDPFNTNNYTILFGPSDFKKKASFCGLDCLEYFLAHIKHLKKGDTHETKI